MATQIAPYPNELRACIKKAGFSFREVSRETGIPESTLYDWAKGNRPIPHHEREIFARLLDCSVEALAPKQSSAAITSVSTNHLVQYRQKHSLSLPEQGDDMDKIRRLILRATGVVGIAFVTPFEQLLEAEPWKRITQAITKPSSIGVDTLIPFQKLTEACWQMSNGSELNTVEQLLPTYLPQLSVLAQQTSEYQQVAAGIASQSYLLSYVVASHREEFKLALDSCKKARTYAQTAHDPNLEAIALIRQGVIGLRCKRPYQALDAYQEALRFVDRVSPLVRARLYANLCEVQGKLGMEQEARRSIGMAQESFPTHPATDPASLYIHFSKSGLYLHEGLALIDLHQPDAALNVLSNIDGLSPKLEISERSRIDVLNQQALAAGVSGKLEQFGSYLEGAVTSARKFGSDMLYSESWDVYTRVQTLYPHESKINSLFA